MISDFLDFLIGGVFDLLSGILGIFPQMPFTSDDLQQYMNVDLVSSVYGWINYFLPLDIASSIVALWATAMMAYIGIKMAIKYSVDVVK